MIRPLRQRFRDCGEGPEVELRFRISGGRSRKTEGRLDKTRYRGGLAGWDGEWAVCLQSETRLLVRGPLLDVGEPVGDLVCFRVLAGVSVQEDQVPKAAC